MLWLEIIFFSYIKCPWIILDNFLPAIYFTIFLEPYYLIFDFIHCFSNNFFSLIVIFKNFFLLVFWEISSSLSSNPSTESSILLLHLICSLNTLYSYLMDAIFSYLNEDFSPRIFLSLCFYFCLVSFSYFTVVGTLNMKIYPFKFVSLQYSSCNYRHGVIQQISRTDSACITETSCLLE